MLEDSLLFFFPNEIIGLFVIDIGREASPNRHSIDPFP